MGRDAPERRTEMEDKKVEVVKTGTTEVEIDATAERVKAIVRLVVALAAGIATVFGWTFDQELWGNILLTAFTLYMLVRELWWKNNNVTVAAMVGDAVTTDIKRGE